MHQWTLRSLARCQAPFSHVLQAAWALEEKEEAEMEAEAMGEELREKQVRLAIAVVCAGTRAVRQRCSKM